MKFSNNTIIESVAFCLLLLIVLSCQKMEDDSFPITNDLRILQINIGNSTVSSGVADVSVLAELEIVFSHALNTSTFEQALSISPAVDYTISYAGNNSFTTITFSNPLAYSGSYTIGLSTGTYGAAGEASTEDFSFTFATESFNAPSVTLSSDKLNFFEGEILVITASIAAPILEEVKMDLVFEGTAGNEIDFTASAGSIVIAAGSTSGSVELTALNDPDLEGEETIIVSLANLVNGVESPSQQLSLALGDLPPALEFKGVMSLKIGGTSTNGRAIHLRVLEDIADLSLYGIGIANNGGGSDGREIDFPALSVLQGEDILLIRDADVGGLMTYFGDCYNEFEHILESGGLNFNGDDPFELYQDVTVIETYGDVELDGTGLDWEWTGTWAYKLDGQWEYGQIDCSANSATTQTSDCVYPFCQPLQLQGVLALLWDGSGTNGGKAVHVRANRDIADLSQYSLGVANNGGGTDGVEYTYPAGPINEGDHILVAREAQTLAAYFGGCFDGFDLVIQDDAMNQNGDDAIELFDGMTVIETYGNADVDGTGETWEYAGSWGYKAGSTWVYGGVDCAAASTSTQTSACTYVFCE